MGIDDPQQSGVKSWWAQSFVRKWWKTEAWQTLPSFNKDPDRPPLFWLRSAIHDHQWNNMPINFWRMDDPYSFRVMRMTDVAVPIGVFTGVWQYIMSGNIRLHFEQRRRIPQSTFITSTLALRGPVRDMISYLPKNIGLAWGACLAWCLTISVLQDNWTRTLLGGVIDLPFSVAKYESKDPHANRHAIHAIGGIAAAVAHHVGAGGSYGEPHHTELSKQQRVINNRSMKFFLIFPLTSLFLSYCGFINEYQTKAGVHGKDSPLQFSENEQIMYKLRPKHRTEGALDHKGRDISWLYPKEVEEKGEGEYVPKVK